MSCSIESNEISCKVFKAYFGNDIPPNSPTREYTYEYFYENEVVSKIEASSINGGNTTTFGYEFDVKNRPYKTILGLGEQEEQHVLYSYFSDHLEVADIRISNGRDTIRQVTNTYFYIENPINDKIYRYTDGFLKNSYTFKDGNVYEFGYYNVVENDTIDTFRQRYFYDDQPNTFYVPAYHVAIYPDNLYATITSKNNIIQVDNFDFNAPFSLNAIYDYDAEGTLIFYKGITGNIVDFEYDCN